MENVQNRVAGPSSSSSSRAAAVEPDPGVNGLCVQCAEHCHTFIGHNVRNIGEGL